MTTQRVSNRRTPLGKGELRRLYAELPTIACQRRCQAWCGPIGMAESEWSLICRHLGHVPRGDPQTLVCPMLSNDGRCTVYQLRPMICRLWGLVEGMECPFGCQPSPRLLSVAEGLVFMLRAGSGGDPMSQREAVELVEQLPPARLDYVRRWVAAAGKPPLSAEQMGYRAPQSSRQRPGPWSEQ